MTVRELLAWQRFEDFHEPLPDRLADIHTAMLAALMCNLVGNNDVRAADFFVIKNRTPPPPPPPMQNGDDEIDRLRRQWRGE